MDDIIAIVIGSTFAALFVVGIPLFDFVSYRVDVKRYGKDMADEIRRRF